jgi:tetratricopeptide (TPR) repeat protein
LKCPLLVDLLKRVFSAEYRRALAAEAAGDYLDAARGYALCGERSKVADMHLARARQEKATAGKIKALRSALDFAPADDPRHRFIARQLADCIRADAAQLDPRSPRARSHLSAAAALLERGHAWAEAGECYLTLGDIDAASRAFGRAGMVERVEQILEERELREDAARTTRQNFDDYRLALSEGARSRALGLLKRCIAHGVDPGPYERLAADLSARLPTHGVVNLEQAETAWRLIGVLPALLGRDESAEIPLRGPTVSRHHARILAHEDGRAVLLEDAGSRNGTFVDGALIGGRVQLHAGSTIRLGQELPELTVKRADGSPITVMLEISDGMDRGRRFVLSTAPISLPALDTEAAPVRVEFCEGIPRMSGIGAPLRLDTLEIRGSVEPLVGDIIAIGGTTLRVT